MAQITTLDDQHLDETEEFKKLRRRAILDHTSPTEEKTGDRAQAEAAMTSKLRAVLDDAGLEPRWTCVRDCPSVVECRTTVAGLTFVAIHDFDEPTTTIRIVYGSGLGEFYAIETFGQLGWVFLHCRGAFIRDSEDRWAEQMIDVTGPRGAEAFDASESGQRFFQVYGMTMAERLR